MFTDFMYKKVLNLTFSYLSFGSTCINCPHVDKGHFNPFYPVNTQHSKLFNLGQIHTRWLHCKGVCQ